MRAVLSRLHLPLLLAPLALPLLVSQASARPEGLPLGPVAPVPAILTASVEKARVAYEASMPDADERHCLAMAIYFEARGESAGGQAAVAQVVLNRTKSAAYPDTICGVVFQNQHRRNACQFSFACDGKAERIREKKAWALAQEIAEDVVAGRRDVASAADATHYHATYVSPRWAPKMRRLAKIGRHVFYQGA